MPRTPSRLAPWAQQPPSIHFSSSQSATTHSTADLPISTNAVSVTPVALIDGNGINSAAPMIPAAVPRVAALASGPRCLRSALHILNQYAPPPRSAAACVSTNSTGYKYREGARYDAHREGKSSGEKSSEKSSIVSGISGSSHRLGTPYATAYASGCGGLPSSPKQMYYLAGLASQQWVTQVRGSRRS